MENILLVSTILACTLSLGIAFTSFYRERQGRQLLDFLYGQLDGLENLLAANTEAISEANNRASDYARRIAWVESRIREQKTAPADPSGQAAMPAKKDAGITEKRYRVLALAKKGLNAEGIASALGMLPGEVELILNLNRATLAHFA